MLARAPLSSLRASLQLTPTDGRRASASKQGPLHNRGSSACTFSIAARAYRTDGLWTVRVEPGVVGEKSRTLGDSGNWYDFVVSCDTAPSFVRRFAGRVESGKDSVSDPAMGKGV